MWEQTGDGPAPELTVPMRLASGLRYGENPHQAAAFYTDLSLAEAARGGIATAQQHHGKEMSYNNYLDGDAAFAAVCDYREPACVIVKHTNPCGISTRADLCEAYELAVQADPVSAFGGIVAFNRPVTEELARRIREFRSPTDGETRMFYEIVIAPEFTAEGLAMLKGKSKTLRILEAQARSPEGNGLRQIGGGWLAQVRQSGRGPLVRTRHAAAPWCPSGPARQRTSYAIEPSPLRVPGEGVKFVILTCCTDFDTAGQDGLRGCGESFATVSRATSCCVGAGHATAGGHGLHSGVGGAAGRAHAARPQVCVARRKAR